MDQQRRDKFNLPVDYVTQPVKYFHDIESGPLFQPLVYAYVQKWMKTHQTRKVIDIGCGANVKMTTWIGYDFLGLDFGPNLHKARSLFPDLRFTECDLETCQTDLSPRDVIDSIIVCSDVIEHLNDPRPLMLWIRQLILSGAHMAILTSPDRHMMHVAAAAAGHHYADQILTGPPYNPCHVREWTINELDGFCQQMGLKVLSKRHTVTVVDLDGSTKTMTSMLDLAC